MKKMLSRALSLVMAGSLVFSMTACGGSADSSTAESAAATETASVEEGHKIGVVVYDVNDNEVQMFRQYFERYLAESFPVEFVYSASVSDWEEEKAFLEAGIEEGVQGFISFNATNLTEAVKLCEDSQVYYMIGSGNYADDLLDQVKDNQWYVGCIGTDDEDDYQAGADMVEAFMANAGENPKVLLATGGAAMGNFMHEMRARGALDKLAELAGYTYDKSMEEILSAEEPFELGTGVDGVTVCICPGYDVNEKVAKGLEGFDPDAAMSVLASSDLVDLVTADEEASGVDAWVGLVDCFSQWNRDFFNKNDSFGNPSLNFVAGKYASIVGPAFAAMYQAVCADPAMLRVDGQAFHLKQGLWEADSPEKYEELYNYTESYTNNAYSSEDLMSVMTAYNPDATFEAFQALTEAADVDSVVERLNK